MENLNVSDIKLGDIIYTAGRRRATKHENKCDACNNTRVITLTHRDKTKGVVCPFCEKTRIGIFGDPMKFYIPTSFVVVGVGEVISLQLQTENVLIANKYLACCKSENEFRILQQMMESRRKTVFRLDCAENGINGFYINKDLCQQVCDSANKSLGFNV